MDFETEIKNMGLLILDGKITLNNSSDEEPIKEIHDGNSRYVDWIMVHCRLCVKIRRLSRKYKIQISECRQRSNSEIKTTFFV